VQQSSIQTILDVVTGNELLLVLLGFFSLLTFITSLIVIPFLVVRIPANYFSQDHRQPVVWAEQHPLIRCALLIVKNLLGLILIVLGIAMLVLPGQGLLTIFIGILCLNFPGKYRFERWLIMQPAIHRVIGWLRKKAGREPLMF
jgi:hypothetical protein